MLRISRGAQGCHESNREKGDWRLPCQVGNNQQSRSANECGGDPLFYVLHSLYLGVFRMNLLPKLDLYFIKSNKNNS
jgi:hypothetical protein